MPLQSVPAFAGNGVLAIIVESPDRFARDLAVQLAGHDHLRSLGVTLIPATAPNFFTEDTPTGALVRQVLALLWQIYSRCFSSLIQDRQYGHR
jgi:DNA invertase Pin-like site-specific DNA recombinase